MDEIKTDELLQGIVKKKLIISLLSQSNYIQRPTRNTENEDGDTYGDEYSEVSNNGHF